MKIQIDHVAHGWALLALRNPEIRALSDHRQSIGEMCEAYSIAVLHLRVLRNLGPDTEHITEYSRHRARNVVLLDDARPTFGLAVPERSVVPTSGWLCVDLIDRAWRQREIDPISGYHLGAS